ncbi:MAG: lactonase family protein [Lachnospiraceae bacterium]|nr:lactonase family protein [Lachnospiraceae bacterium]
MAGVKSSEKAKYVAYGAGYTSAGHTDGIRVFDYHPENGRITEKNSIRISNASYINISHNKKFLYSITDQGVVAFRIKEDGDLEYLNEAPINGMRGCYVATDYDDRFVFVSGYHDGKVTVLSLKKDGSVDHICDEIYHKGLGSVGERNFRPHVDCARMTMDNKYLLATDVGMDHVKVYRLNRKTGKLTLADILRSDIESAPHQLRFSYDGKFAYIIHELGNNIDVYTYEDMGKEPRFTKIQSVSTVNEKHVNSSTAAYALHLSKDNHYLFCSNAGDDSIGCFERDMETGMLTRLFVLPVSGIFPKDFAVSDDNQYLLSMNHESNTITFFHVDTKKRTMVMTSKEIYFQSGNCLVIHKVV